MRHALCGLFATCSADPSFPSDHASAAIAIAAAVVLSDRTVGAIFLAGATLVVAGVHYAALLGTRLGRPLIGGLVRIVERVTDPVMARLWRIAPRAFYS